MKFKSILGILCIICILGIPAISYTTTEITAPSSTFETQTSTSVNVSGGVNASAYPARGASDWINVTIYNKSCQSCSYSAHSDYVIQASNGSTNIFWNQTITLTAGYNWVYLNFTNISTRTLPKHAATAARIINVDPDMYLLNVGGLGAINMTLDKGDLTLNGCIKYNCSGGGSGCITLGTCDK